MIIVGIDPGSVCTGYSVVQASGSRLVWLDGGVIKPPRQAGLPERLLILHSQLGQILADRTVDGLAMEECFMGRYARAALVLGHARGALMVAALGAGVPVYEYAPRSVKMAVTGVGGASKEQIQRMIPRLVMGAPEELSPDEADAVAVAVCHINRAGQSDSDSHLASVLQSHLK